MELDPKCLSVNATARMLHPVRSILAHRWSISSFWIPTVLPLSPPNTFSLSMCSQRSTGLGPGRACIACLSPRDPLDLVRVEVCMHPSPSVLVRVEPLSPAPGDPLVLVPVELHLSARSQ